MKIDILSNLIEALEQETLKEIVENGQEAYSAYLSLIKDQEKVIDALHPAQESEENASPLANREEIDLLIDELAESFQFKLKKFENERKREEQKINQKEKETLIENLRTLISEEENIGKAFITFNNLQEKWNSIGEVPATEFHRIQSEYSRLRESFYYNIKIYKELADHDKKRNQDRKSEIIEQVKLLTKEKSINKQNTRIRELIKEWDNIGMTYEDSWNTLREEFWTNARSILNKIDGHYNELRAKAGKNLTLKQELVDKVVATLEFEHTKSNHWKKSSDKIIAIQKDWKKIGPSDKNEEIWKTFRKACDNFFNAKKEFYNSLSAKNSEVEDRKNELIRQSEILKDSDDWKDTTKAIIRLQEEWKKAGSTNPRKENILWKTFRTNLDQFFKRKSEFFAGKEDREKENLVKKIALIDEIKALALTGNVGQDIAALKELSSRWEDIGFIPFSKKDKVYKDYKSALDSKYDQLKVDKSEKSKIRFRNKIESLKGQKDPGKAIDYERRRIRKQIEELKSSILQTENNLGFFNVSKGGDSMLNSVNKKLKKDKDRVDELITMLKELNKA